MKNYTALNKKFILILQSNNKDLIYIGCNILFICNIFKQNFNFQYEIVSFFKTFS